VGLGKQAISQCQLTVLSDSTHATPFAKFRLICLTWALPPLKERDNRASLSRKKLPGAISFARRAQLFNPLAATLDQDDQHDYRKDSGYDPNDCYIVHVNSPFSMSEVLVKTFHHGDCRWT
jgi:hypothetical protein